MRPLFLLFAIPLFAIPWMAVGQEPPPGTYRIGNGVSPPQIVQKQEPQYSDEARIANMEGAVVLALVVSEDGVPSNIHVTRSLGLGLDENAVRTVTGWRFKPGMKEGKAVPVLANVSVSFRLLLDDNAWRLTRASFATPAGVSRPVISKAMYPPSSGPVENATVKLSMDIDEKGIPANIHAMESSDPKWESEVNELMRGWRFEPGIKDGHPVTVPATLEFKRGNENALRNPPPQGAYQLGGGVTAPAVIYKVEPAYSEKARVARLEGKVVLIAVVTPEGQPTEIRVVRSLGLGLDEQAVEAVKQWRFSPGMKDGNPVAVQITIEVNFRR
jgi:TonB family protein